MLWYTVLDILCTYQYSRSLQKAITITFTALKMYDKQLITIGDAAASFIQKPDPTTKGLCLYTRKEFCHSDSDSDSDLELFDQYRCSGPKQFDAKPKRFNAKTKRRENAASRQRWEYSINL